MSRIVIFASGSGSNAENIFNFFRNDKSINIVSILTNNKNAKVLERAEKLKVNSIVFSRKDFMDESILGEYLKNNADYIVLAGFLWKIPEYIVKAFPNKIINIHPALLPKYGGKGMYGMNVHRSVVQNKETETGITIHYVNEHYDEGIIIFQASTEVNESDTPDDVAQKIHKLEFKYFPKIIEKVILENE
jgi:phosphoribosylglycinamide formyltransferase-1